MATRVSLNGGGAHLGRGPNTDESSSSGEDPPLHVPPAHLAHADLSKKRRKQSRPLRIPLSPKHNTRGPLNLSTNQRPPSPPTLPPPLPPHRIFNPEAFCQLCNKEFCNKYFLKTHKANKHGVYADAPTNGPPSRPDQDSLSGTENGKSAAEGKEEGELGEALCHFCSRPFPSEPALRRHLAKKHGLLLPPFLLDPYPFPATPPLAPLFDAAPSSAECRPCARSFPSHYLLQMHNAYFHPPTPPPVPEPAPPTPRPDETTSDSDDLRRLESMILDLKNPGREWSPGQEAQQDPAPSSALCPICSKEFFSAYFLAQHMDEAHRDEDGARDAPKDKRPSPSLSRSYCTICHKELCNKYFMRTHMLKMHGISIESSTGLGGVTCDVCHKELCSKYFLKVHKQNTHGIVDEPASPHSPPPQTPPPKERRRPKKKKEPTLDPLALLFTKMDGGGKLFRCTMCPFSTPLLVYLIAHEKTHGPPPAPALQCPLCFQALDGLEGFHTHLQTHHGIATTPPAPAQTPKPRRTLFRCSACKAAFRQRHDCDAHIASKHAKRPPRGFGCPKCRFRSPTYGKLWIHLKLRHGSRHQMGVSGVRVLGGDGAGVVQRFVVRCLGEERRFLAAAVELAVREPVREAVEVRFEVMPTGEAVRRLGD